MNKKEQWEKKLHSARGQAVHWEFLYKQAKQEVIREVIKKFKKKEGAMLGEMYGCPKEFFTKREVNEFLEQLKKLI